MTYVLIVVALALLGSLYTILLNYTQRRSANNPIPQNVSDVYDAATYQTWRAYSAEHCRLELIYAVASLVVTLALLLTKSYAAFAALFPPSLEFFPVILLESLVGFLLESVKSYVSTMVIEEKYGFNRSTKKTFVIDRIRSLIFGLEQKKPENWDLKLPMDKIRKYFPRSYTPQRMEETIIKLLEMWMKQQKKKREQQR